MRSDVGLRRPGAVLLVSCYELGSQPLRVAWPLSFLQRAGFSPRAVDVAVEQLDAQAIARADVVAIAVPMHTAMRLGTAVARRVRMRNSSARICMYGLYALLNQRQLLESGICDHVLAGEFEEDLVRWILHLAEPAPARDPTQTSPLATRATLRRLNFSVPNRRQLPPLERYARLERGEHSVLAGAVETTRGCLHRCRHCPIVPVYQGRFFAVPRRVVLDDVDQLVAMGAEHISFRDPDFLNGPRHAMRIVEQMHRRHPRLSFDFTAKVSHLLRHRRLLPELAGFGCAFAITAVESLCDRVLAILDKGHTAAEVLQAIEILRGEGIAPRPTWVAFTPWTGLDDYRRILGFVAEQGLIGHVDCIQYAVRLLVPPGSLLLDHPALQPHLRGLDDTGFCYRWQHPDPRMDRLQRSVAEAVEQATSAGDNTGQTFLRVWRLAAAVDDLDLPPPVLPQPLPIAPRMSEFWFC